MLDDELHFLLLRAFNYSNRRIARRIREIGLLPGQPKILEYLSEHDGCTAKDICSGCVLDKSTMTNLLARLESRGLIRREADAADRRASRVYLTAQARAYIERIAEITDDINDTATQGMSKKESRALRAGLRTVIANLREDEQN